MAGEKNHILRNYSASVAKLYFKLLIMCLYHNHFFFKNQSCLIRFKVTPQSFSFFFTFYSHAMQIHLTRLPGLHLPISCQARWWVTGMMWCGFQGKACTFGIGMCTHPQHILAYTRTVMASSHTDTYSHNVKKEVG